MPVFGVTAYLDEATSVQEVSKIFEGLQRLENRGKLRLSIARRKGGRSWPRVISLAVRAESRGMRRIAIDLSDQRDLLDRNELESADVYFKRSFCSEAASVLPSHLSAKVEPFGLNSPAIGLRAAIRVLRSRIGATRSLSGLVLDARQLLALPSPAAFECTPDICSEPLVLFQTRVWPSDDPDVIRVNNQRASLVKTLRNALGIRFIGGIVPSEFAKDSYPDVVTQLPYSMRAYPKLVRRAIIGVYSHGLHGSVAFKMSEYLAASRCIVADSVDAVLPEPLVKHRNYLPFDDPAQCVAQCELLLSDPSAAQEMRRANWDYYRSQVEPGAHLLRILDRAFARCPTG
jgi:hypothetical protein